MEHCQRQERLSDIIKVAGFQYFEDAIHLFVGGSELHGAKVIGTDDIDLYGIYIEPPEKILGLDHSEHFVWSTSGADRRNTAEDIDVTLFSLRKYAGLVCKGNPTALHFLFAKNMVKRPEFFESIREDIKHYALSRKAVSQFKGFVDAQMGRLLGTCGRGKKGQRPELEAKYGYDVKAAMHAVRLCYECIELLKDANITLPRPERELKELIAIRSGEWSLDRVSDKVNQLMQDIERAEAYSPLGDQPDRDRLSSLISQTYLRYWKDERTQRSLRKANRPNYEKQQAAKREMQRQCPHTAGSLGTYNANHGGPTCIVWHIFEDDPHHAVGICMHCGRQWRYTDADYEEWRNKRSINKLSTGGLHRSSAYPYSEGILMPSVDSLAIVKPVELVDEPPLDMSLKEFVLSEVLKRKPVEAAKLLANAHGELYAELIKGGVA